jgi:solute carrier family 25 protein 16
VLITYPLDFVRTRLAYTMETNHGRQTIRATLQETMRGEGLVGMYRGIGPSIYGILPYAGLKFYVYQQLKQLYFSRTERSRDKERDTVSDVPAVAAHTRLPVPYMLMFGGIAGLVAQTATYPIDVVRRRMQVEGLQQLQQPRRLPQLQQSKGPNNGSSTGAPLLPRTTLKALLYIARNEGWGVLWSGLSINYLKVVPSTAIGFTLYDMLKQKLLLPRNL